MQKAISELALVGNRPLISAGVRVLVEDQAGRFLITRRADSDIWCLPGGSMEYEIELPGAYRITAEVAGGIKALDGVTDMRLN